MNKVISSLALALLTGVMAVQAQAPARVASTGGTSPHETTSAVIDGNRVTITYGRPFTKSKSGEVRKVWGGLVPFGKAWRMGADEATTLITQQDIVLGGTTLPAGAYTLYLVPEENGAKLAISKKVGQWGVPVDEKNDVARVDMAKAATPAPVEQFTMAVAKNPSGTGGVIKASWETTEYSVAFTKK